MPIFAVFAEIRDASPRDVETLGLGREASPSSTTATGPSFSVSGLSRFRAAFRGPALGPLSSSLPSRATRPRCAPQLAAGRTCRVGGSHFGHSIERLPRFAVRASRERWDAGACRASALPRGASAAALYSSPARAARPPRAPRRVGVDAASASCLSDEGGVGWRAGLRGRVSARPRALRLPARGAASAAPAAVLARKPPARRPARATGRAGRLPATRASPVATEDASTRSLECSVACDRATAAAPDVAAPPLPARRSGSGLSLGSPWRGLALLRGAPAPWRRS